MCGIPTVYIYEGKKSIVTAVESSFDKVLAGNVLGNTVFIKPNWVVGKPSQSGVTTDVEAVRTLASLLREAGASRVIVGEAAIENTASVFNALGVSLLAAEGIEVVNLEGAERKQVELSNARILKKFSLPEVIFEADMIISFAKLKAHDLTGVTLTVKNLFGFLSTPYRKLAHYLGIHQALVELYEFFSSNFQLAGFIDGMVGLEGRLAPTHGKPVPVGVILAGDNLVAVDMVGCQIMGVSIERVQHLRLLRDRFSVGQVITSGISAEEVFHPFEMPELFWAAKGFFQSRIQKVFRKLPYVLPEACSRCGSCAQICPCRAVHIKDNNLPQIDTGKCISCLCCCEGCPEGAMSYSIRHERAYRLLKQMKAFGSRYIK